ncbi:hypothetical protein FLONG3_230 [Fusarium longipes]|uniref:Uncharacterized protein n=1 Tax=Fusarium longipes TaxID=694270 RepID=A0A395TA73_9HYPO|nr:hypothetical protein FLONG3_230 [Fusarium longipes]
MERTLYYWLTLCLCVISTNAVAISEATKRRDAGYIYQPAPTPMVALEALKHLNLGKRQASTTVATTFTVVISPDSTCGFLSGSPGNAITCSNGDLCSWELAHVQAIFCGTTAHLQCLDREDALNTELCDDVCRENSYNLLCTDSSAPYCGTYAYQSGVRAFKCSSSSMTRAQSVSFIYNNQKDRSLTTTIFDSDATDVTLSDLDTVESTSTLPKSSTTQEPEPTETTDTSSGGGSKTNIGAIVGGSIGGFLVLSFIVLGLIWFLRRNKKKNHNAPPVQQVPPPVAPQQHFPQTPASSVPPMNQNYPKTEVSSPAPTEWRESTITAQSPNSPVSSWTGQYPNPAADGITYQEMPGSSPYGR